MAVLNALRLVLTVALLPLVLPWMGYLWLLHHNHLKVVSKTVAGVQRVGIVYSRRCARCTQDAVDIAKDVDGAELIPTPIDAKTSAEVLWTKCPVHGQVLEQLGIYRGVDCSKLAPICAACVEEGLARSTIRPHSD